MAILKDTTLELDDFSRNKIITGLEVEAQQLYMLLIMRPGDCADEPEKGIDMSKYRIGIGEQNASELKAAIEKQVDLYCDFQISDIEVMYNNGELVVGIKTPSSNDIIMYKTASTETVLTTIINA